MARLQVQAHAYCLSDLHSERLWLVYPRVGVEVDEHVVASAEVRPRLNVSNLQQPWPCCAELFRKLCRPWVVRATVNLDGEVALGKLEAGGALQVDVAPRLGQQALAHEDHRAVLEVEGRDARPLERRLLQEGVADLCGRWRLQ
eukprot:7375199-Prymnesium_polylepis.1